MGGWQAARCWLLGVGWARPRRVEIPSAAAGVSKVLGCYRRQRGGRTWKTTCVCCVWEVGEWRAMEWRG